MIIKKGGAKEVALSYVGSFKNEVKIFENFDGDIHKLLQSVANSIGDLSTKWKDKYSKEYLDKFNTGLKESITTFKSVHNQLRTYLSTIQELLMEVAVGGSNESLPEFSELEYSEITDLDMTGFEYSFADVKRIVSDIKLNARAVIDSVNDFNPQLTSVSGDDDMGISTAIKSNFATAASAYGVLVSPLNSIIKTCGEVEDLYNQIAQKIADSGQ